MQYVQQNWNQIYKDYLIYEVLKMTSLKDEISKPEGRHTSKAKVIGIFVMLYSIVRK
jgi:hypothetical protein